MLALIRAIHGQLKGAYGSPRMVLELRARGFSAGKARVERLMRENGIRARHKRRFKATTDSKHSLPVAPNLLDRHFTPAAPNQVWTSDTPICGQMKAGCTWPSCLICSTARWWAGR
jgi:putative transposase